MKRYDWSKVVLGMALGAFCALLLVITGSSGIASGAERAAPLSVIAPSDVALSGPGVGESGSALTFVAATSPLTTTLPLTFTWEASGHAPAMHLREQLTDTFTVVWTLGGAQAITVTAANGAGGVTGTRAVLIDPTDTLYLPLVLRRYPPGPVIHFFRANVEIANPGDTIILEWASEDATAAVLYRILPTGQYGYSWVVDVSGSMVYEIPETWRNYEGFLLRVSDDAALWAQAYLGIPLICPDAWFFEPAPNECPAAPALYSAGAEQPFEHGLMLWVGEQDFIYVLSDDGFSRRWSIYVDAWNEGDPIDDPSIIPPPGFYQPLRGFGLVWRENPDVRERLGWATAPEAGYETAVQRTSRWKYNEIYVRALDGGVWRLLPEGSGWEHLPAP